jgi:hypothetical protein
MAKFDVNHLVLVHYELTEFLLYNYMHRVRTYIGRDETGHVYLPTQQERTLQLCT